MTRKGVLGEKALLIILILAGLLGVFVVLWNAGIIHAPAGGATGAASKDTDLPPEWTASSTKFVLQKNTPLLLNLADFFKDPEGQALTFIATQTENLDVQVQDNALTITPEPGFAGERVVTVIASDGTQVASKRLNIEVGGEPAAAPAPQPGEAAAAPAVESPREKIEPALEQALATAELVDAIIILKEPATAGFAPQGAQRKEDVLREQKEQVDEAQNALLATVNDIPAQGITGAAIADQVDMEVVHTYDTVNALAVRLTRAGLEKLRNDPNVEQVVADRTFMASLAESVPLIDADDVWNLTAGDANVTGKGEAVCIVDTGIDFNHSAFTNNIVGGHDYVNGDDSPQDDAGNSHGTHVAGIAAGNSSVKGVAPDARIVPVKVCNSGNSCTASDILSGIDYCNNNSVAFNITAISMSLGDNSQYNSTTCPTLFDDALNTSVSLGIIPVAASGNNGFTNGISYPACSPFAISVGSTTKADAMSSFTNRGGDRLDVLAPGSSITSSVIGGGTGTLSGTSMATPHISGVIALVQQSQKSQGKAPLSLLEMRALLKETGKLVSSWNRVDALAAIVQMNQNYTLNITDSSVTNRTPPTAKVKFHSYADLSRFIGCSHVQYNFVSIDSAACPQYNASAHITFSGLPGIDAVPLRNGDACPASICQNASFSAGTLDFDVTEFSNYSSNSTFATSATCGSCAACTTCLATAGNTCTLTTSLSAAAGAGCATFGASNTTFDCAGFSIVTPGNGGVLIYATAFNNIVITGCVLTNGTISFDNVGNVTVKNNTLFFVNESTASSGTLEGAIRASNVSRANITRNVVFLNTSINGDGIRIGPNSTLNTIEYNNVTVSKVTESGFSTNGIDLIHTDTIIAINSTTIRGNNILMRGRFLGIGSAGGAGIRISPNITNTTLVSNTIAMNGTFNGVDLAGGDITMTANDTVINFTNPDNVVVWIVRNTNTGSNSFTNTTFAQPNGSINYAGTFTVSAAPPTLDSAGLNITFNLAFVNSSGFPFLNAAATIRLRNVPFTFPRLLLNGATCPSSTCTLQSFANNEVRFTVTGFTNYSVAEQGLSMTKNDSADPVNVSDLFNYTIFFNTSTNASNITLTDAIPSQLAFVSAQPAPVSGTTDTYIIGNLSENQTFTVNITVRALLVKNGTVVTNIANISFQNSTGAVLTAIVAASTTILAPVIESCPATINQTIFLDRSLSSNGTCITFGNSSTVIDCSSNTITYGINGGNENMGVNITNTTNVTLQNCIIVKGNSTGLRTYGIGVIGSTNVTLRNNTITTNGTGTDDAIHVSQAAIIGNSSGTKTLISDSVSINSPFCTNITGSLACVPCMGPPFTNRVVGCPTAAGTNGGCSFGGVKVFETQTMVVFSTSSLPVGGFISEIGGEHVECSLNGNVVVPINPHAEDTCGFYRQFSIPQSAFTVGSNTLSCKAGPSGKSRFTGLKLSKLTYDFPFTLSSANSSGITIANNTIVAGGGADSRGVYIEAPNSTITNNTITTAGNATNHGIFLQAERVNVTNNIIVTRAGNSSHGILAPVDNIIITGNSVTTAGNNSFSHGIFLDSGANYVLVANNSVQALARTSDALHLVGATGNTLLNNTVISATRASLDLETSLSNIVNATFLPALPTSLFIAETDGNINFTLPINITNLTNFSQIVNISFNFSRVNTTGSVGQQLNKTAALSFFSIPAQGIIPVFDAADSSVFAVCNAPRCTNISYNQTSGVLRYNVSSFTTYAAQAVSACASLDFDSDGDTINQTNATFTLTNPVSAIGSCFLIANDNITLDCAGFPINGTNTGVGINATNVSNIVIKNCFVENFSIDIFLSQVNGSAFINNTARNSTSFNFWVTDSSHNVFRNNTMRSQTTDAFVFSALNFLQSVFNNTLINNTAVSSGGRGISISEGSNYTVINNTGNSTAGFSPGIEDSAPLGSGNSTWSGNIGIASGSSGLSVGGVSSVIDNNTGTSKTGSGIFIGGFDNRFSNNIGTTNASSTAFAGITLSLSVFGNTLINNTGISTAGGHGILVLSNGNLMRNNNGTANTSNGIEMEGASHNILINNTGFSVSGHGINLKPTSFLVQAYDSGTWVNVSVEHLIDNPNAAYRYSTRTVTVPSGTTKIRLTHSGSDTAHLDMALLDGTAPLSITDLADSSSPSSAKLAAADYDVIEAVNRTIVLEWAAPGTNFTVSGIEEDLAGVARVSFPSWEGYYNYTLGASEAFDIPWHPASSHPAGNISVTLAKAPAALLVSVDMTPDNTLDTGADWLEFRVFTDNGTLKFPVNSTELTWGTGAYVYTDKAAYQHKTYNLSIPMSALSAAGDTLRYQIGYYGTGGGSPCTNDTLINNTGTSTSGVGIRLETCTFIVMLRNNGSSTSSHGIEVTLGSSNNLTLNNGTTSSGSGIRLGSTSDNILLNNTGKSVSGRGILLDTATTNILQGNNGSSTSSHGIELSAGSGNNLTFDNGTSVNGSGILLTGTTGNVLANTTGRSTNGSGIALSSSSSTNTLLNNTALSANAVAFLLSGSNSNLINGTLASSGNGTGMNIVSSQTNALAGNNVFSGAGDALLLAGASANNFTSTTLASDRGIAAEALPGGGGGNFFDGFEDGTLPPFTTAGNNIWAINNTDVASGSFSAQAGDINDSQSSAITLAFTSPGPGIISFARKVESEAGFDFLRFYIDGALQISWSGLLPYATFNFSTGGGSQTFTWNYSKDSSVTVANDTAFIDNINITFTGNGSVNNTFNKTVFFANLSWLFIGANDTNNTFDNTTFVGKNGSLTIVPAVRAPTGANATIGRLNNTHNLTFLNSTVLAFFNTTAILRFLQTAFIDPAPVRDLEDDGTFGYCPPSVCAELAYIAGEFIYNTTGFSFYAATEGQVNLTINKTDSPDPVPASSQLNYTIVVNNSGSSTAFNLTLLEIYPNEVIFLSAQPTPEPGTNNTFFLGNFTPESQIRINITVFVRNITADSVINNTINATFLNQSNVTIRANVTENTTVTNPAVLNMSTVTITKSDSPDPVNASQNLTYVINVTSIGPGIARNVTVNDTYPSQVIFLSAQPTPVIGTNNTFFLGNITNGTSVLINITVLVRNVTDGIVINNSANVTFQNNTNFTFTAVATANTNVSNPAPVNVSIITVTKADSPDPVSQGGTLSYTITVTASGGANSSNVTVNDTYPAGVVFNGSQPAPLAGTNNTFILGNLTSGTVVVLNITVNVSSSATGTLTNNVNVTFQNATGGNLSATASATTTISVPAVAGGGGGYTTPTIGGVNRTRLEQPAVQAPSVCVESWTCDDWGRCEGGTQIRACTDSSQCNTDTLKPATSQACAVPQPPAPEEPLQEAVQPQVNLPQQAVPAVSFLSRVKGWFTMPSPNVGSLSPDAILPWKWISAIVLVLIGIIVLLASLRKGERGEAPPAPRAERPAAPEPRRLEPKAPAYKPQAAPSVSQAKMTKSIQASLKETDRMLKELEQALKKSR